MCDMWRESCHCGGQRQGFLLIKHIFTCTLQADCLSDPSDVFFYLRVSTIIVDNYADTRDKLKTVSALHSCAPDRSHF